MAEETNKVNISRGFYYDTQLNNPLMTATLHPNTYATQLVDENGNTKKIDPFTIPGAFTWKLYNPGSTECLEALTTNHTGNENPSASYRKEPLIKAILTEDFQIEIGNSWSDHNGGDEIERMVNSLKSLAPYKQEGATMLDEVGNKLQSLAEDSQPFMGKVAGWGANAAKNISNFMGKGVDRLNGAFIMQGTRFSYYSGTATNFGNLTMRFTLFADWKIKDGKPEFVTVHDQLNEIYPYVMGKFRPIKINASESKPAKVVDNLTKTNLGTSAGESVDWLAENFFGWQDAPAGFRADVRSIDCCQKGTMRLVLGGYYTIENLVIGNMSVNLSKTMCKVPPKAKYKYGDFKKIKSVPIITENEDGELYDTGEVTPEDTLYGTYEIQEIQAKDYETTPLYADVTLVLKPASSYTNNSLSHFTGNRGRKAAINEITSERAEAIKAELEKKREIEANPSPQYPALDPTDNIKQTRQDARRFEWIQDTIKSYKKDVPTIDSIEKSMTMQMDIPADILGSNAPKPGGSNGFTR